MNYRSRSLLNLAHRLNTCTRCGHYVMEGLEPAHSDSGRHGKGMGMKADDHFHAAICHACHVELASLPREEREWEWLRAFEKTLTEYFKRGWLMINTKGTA